MSLDRVASFAQFQMSTADMLRTQRDLAELTRQASSGKVADDLAGYDGKLTTLVSSRGFMQRAEAFSQLGRELGARFEIQAQSLSRIADATIGLRDTVLQVLALDDATEIPRALQNAVNDAAGALNTSFAGQFVFAGERSADAPFLARTVADITAAASVDDLFQAGTRRQVAQVDDTTRSELAPLAPEVGRDMVQAIRDLAAAAPFGRPPSPAARAALETAATALEAAHVGIVQQQGIDGARARRVEDLQRRQDDFVNLLTGTVANIEMVDMAEVATRLNAAQVQLQASASVLGTLSRLNLLEFLR
jgi:flagellin-like hook-associated protein FlgL